MKSRLKLFFRQVLFCLRQVGLPLLIMTIVASQLDQWINGHIQEEMASPQGASATVWLWGCGSLIVNFFAPLMELLMVFSALSFTQKSMPWRSFLKQNLEQCLIEEMRAWGNALLWSFAFILPGLLRFFEYLFVPFVVCFDSQYHQGKRDALTASRKLAKGRWGALLGIFFLFSILIPLILTAFDSDQLIWQSPIRISLVCFVEMLSNICFIVGLAQIYQAQSAGALHEPDVSMARN